MTLLISLLLLVVFLAVVVRIAGSAVRLGLTLAVLSLAMLLAVCLWRGTAVQAPVTVAFSAEASSLRTPNPEARTLNTNYPLESNDEAGIPLELVVKKVKTPPRPAWVESAPERTGDVYRVAVASGPQEKLAECPAALDAQLQKAVQAYIDEYLGPAAGGKLRVSDYVNYDSRYIRKHLVKPANIYEEKLQLSFGPMYQEHALVEFGPEFRKELDSRRADIARYAQELAMAVRLRGLALGFGAVLCLLVVVFSYFRLDTVTRGYYTGRLQFMAATAILIVIVAGALLANRVM